MELHRDSLRSLSPVNAVEPQIVLVGPLLVCVFLVFLLSVQFLSLYLVLYLPFFQKGRHLMVFVVQEACQVMQRLQGKSKRGILGMSTNTGTICHPCL